MQMWMLSTWWGTMSSWDKNIDNRISCCSDYYKPTILVMAYEVPMILMLDMKDWNIPQCIDEEVVLP